MLRALMRYGGTAAKVRAMYGRRFRPADYARLIDSRSVSEAAAFVRSSPGWNTAGDGDLENALKGVVNDEFTRIYKFMSREDHPLLRSVIRRSEQNEILRFYKLINAGTPQDYECELPEFFRKHSGVDFSRFHDVTDIDGLRLALSPTEYRDAIVPDYTLCKTILDTRYYSEAFRVIDKHYGGDVTLKEGFGGEVDLLNIVTLARIKTYFRSMSDSAAEYLIPLRYRLKPALIDAMLKAADGETVLALATASPYGKLFAGADFNIMDDYLQKRFYEFHRRVLAAPVPSVYTPLAYLHLKELEYINIVKIIECVRYGTTPERAGVYLPGVGGRE